MSSSKTGAPVAAARGADGAEKSDTEDALPTAGVRGQRLGEWGGEGEEDEEEGEGEASVTKVDVCVFLVFV